MANTVAMYTRHTSPSHNAQKSRQPPVAPPPRNRVKPKSPPLGEGVREGNSSPKDSQESLEDEQPVAGAVTEQPVAGAVTKMKGLFDQACPPPHVKPTPPPRSKPGVKPSPPPRASARNSQPVANKRSSPEHKARMPLLTQSLASDACAKSKPSVPLHATKSLDPGISGTENNHVVKALKGKFSHISQECAPHEEEIDKETVTPRFHSVEDEKKTDRVPRLQKVFRRSNSESFRNQAITVNGNSQHKAKPEDEKAREIAVGIPIKKVKKPLGVVKVIAKIKSEHNKDKITGTSQSKPAVADKPVASRSGDSELNKSVSLVSQPGGATSSPSKLTITPLVPKHAAAAAHGSRHPSAVNAVARHSMAPAISCKPGQTSTSSVELPRNHSGGSHEPSAPPTSKPPSYESAVLKNTNHVDSSGYETVEFTPLPTGSENKPPSVSGISSAKPALPYAITTVAQSSEPCRAEAKPRMKPPAAVASVTRVPTKTERKAGEGARHAPQRSCYENVFIKKFPGNVARV